MAHPQHGKQYSLKAQNDTMTNVIRGCHSKIKFVTWIVDGYHVITSRAAWALELLLEVARSIPAARYIHKLAQQLERLPPGLIELITDRLSNTRSNVKSVCDDAELLGAFHFINLRGDERIARIDVLFTGDNYVCPEKPPIPPSTTPTGEFDTERPYLHPSLIAGIQNTGLFAGHRSFASQHADKFASTDPRFPDRKEMADGIVALVSTAIRCLLDEYHTGKKVNITFSETAYESTYRKHRAELARNRTSAPRKMSKIMSELYAAVVGTKAVADHAGAAAAGSFHLVDLPDDDA